MKTTETKASNPSPRSGYQSFFNKMGPEAFFSAKQETIQTKPFFNKSPNQSSIQPKLSIGQPGDKYEQEADSMADEVVQRLVNPEVEQEKATGLNKADAPLLQTKCDACEQEEKQEEGPTEPELQAKPIFESIAAPSEKEIQTKPLVAAKSLSIGQPGGPYEQEADATAGQVVEKLNQPQTPLALSVGPPVPVGALTPVIQPKCASCEQEEKLQLKEEQELPEESLQRKPVFESSVPPSEENIQLKCASCEQQEKLQKKEGTGTGQSEASSVEERLAASRGLGSPMIGDTRQQMETAFGTDFGNVRIHTNAAAVQMNKDLHAQAFTHGSDIYFDSGKYNPENQEGKRLLAHELTHTIQQQAVPKKKEKPPGKLAGENTETAASKLPKAENSSLATSEKAAKAPAQKPAGLQAGTLKPADGKAAETKKNAAVNAKPAASAKTARKTNPKGALKSEGSIKTGRPARKRTQSLRKSSIGGAKEQAGVGRNAVATPAPVNSTAVAAGAAFHSSPVSPGDFSGGPEIRALFEQFRAASYLHRQQVNNSTLSAKTRISQSGQQAIQQLSASIDANRSSLEARFAAAKEHVSQKGQQTDTALQNKAADSHQAHQNQQASVAEQLNSLSGDSADAVTAEASQQSDKLLAHGESSATSISAGSEARATRAIALGNSFASRHSGKMANEGAQSARGHGEEVAASLREQGQMLEEATRRDATSMSADIAASSSEAVGQFQSALGQASASFLSFAPVFGVGVEQLLQTSTTYSRDLEQSTSEKLETAEHSALLALDELEWRFTSLADTGVSKGQLVVEDASATRLSLLDYADEQVFNLLNGVPADPEGKFASGISEIQVALQESLLEADTEVSQATGRIEQEINQGENAASTGANQLDAATQEKTNELETRALDGFNQIATSSESVFDQYVEEISAAFDEALACVSGKALWAVEQLINDLGLAEQTGEEKLDERNETASAEQEGQFRSFAEYLRDELTEFLGGGRFIRTVVSIALLPLAITEYFVGVVAGLISAVLKLIVGLVVLVLAIVAALLVLGFVVGVLFMILWECIGFLPALILSLIALVVGLVLLVVVVIVGVVAGLLLMIIMILYNIYKSLTDASLSPFERGFLIGEAIGDILLLLLPLKAKLKIRLPVWLARRLAPLTARARLLARLLLLTRGNVARLVRLIGLFGNDLVKLERFLILFNDAALLERVMLVLGDVARLERVLPLVDDVAQLGRLVRLVRNGARLEALLRHPKLRNATQLERLLGNPKLRDSAQLETLLGNAKIADAAQLERLLGNAKVRNAAELESLLGNNKISNASEIERLLANPKVRNAGELVDLLNNPKITDLAELERLIALTDNTGQLRRMLNIVNTAEDLEIYLILAGGQRQASLLERLLQRAVNMGDYHRVEQILNIASGNAAKFEMLGNAVGKFGLQTPAAPPPANLHGYSGINTNHFLKRHTYEFFDFGDIKANNTFWPQGTDVAAKVEEALTILDNMVPPRRIMPFEQPPVTVTLSDGVNTTVGVNNANRVGQFFPFEDQARGVFNFVKNEMEAIKVLLIP